MPSIKSRFSTIYHHLLPDFFDLDAPEEKIATCNTCLYQLSPNHLKSNTKCCDYFPYLPNYLVGGILQDKNPLLYQGQQRILKKIHEGIGVTPFGIFPDYEYRKKFKSNRLKKKNEEIISKKEINELRCPYFDNGLCSIWAYRERTCVTHFCHSSAGKNGIAFQKELKKYMENVEFKLMSYALNKLHFHDLTQKNNDMKKIVEFNTTKDVNYTELWKDWNKNDFYIKCYELTKALNKDTINIDDGESLNKLKLKRLEMIENILPEKMFLNKDVKFKKVNSLNWEITLGDYSENISIKILPILLIFKDCQDIQKIIVNAYKNNINIVSKIENWYYNQILKN